MNKDFIKKTKRALARWAYYFFLWFFSVIPYSMVKAMSNGLITIAFCIVKRMRKIAKESLTIAFGKEKSEAEIEEIIRKCFFNLGRSGIEMFVYTRKAKLITDNFSFSPGSRENLENALKDGKGVMAFSAHFGNFPLMLLYLAQCGFPTNAIIRPSRDEKIEESFEEARTRLGLKTIHSIPKEICVRKSLKALRNKELLVVLLDQNTGSKAGIYVDFFGQKAGTATGPMIFALRTGSPLIPMFTMRNGEDSHQVVVEPHFYMEQKETDEATLQFNVQKVTTIIEGYIRKYPAEWGWMHRRWKSKMSEG